MKKLAFEELSSINGGKSAKSPAVKNSGTAKSPRPTDPTPAIASPSGTATTARENLVTAISSTSALGLSGVSSSSITPIALVPVSTGAISRVQILHHGV